MRVSGLANLGADRLLCSPSSLSRWRKVSGRHQVGDLYGRMYGLLVIARMKADNLDNVPEMVSQESISLCQHDLILSTNFDVL